MKIPATAALPHAQERASPCSQQLARFFPDMKPVRIRAVLIPLRSGTEQIRESVLVEFASARTAIFRSSLPLEFDDRVRLSEPQGNAQSDATVIAVQYEHDSKAVAVQFAAEQPAWVKNP